MNKKAPYTFNFSLEVLNHLGRGLYRNFATVIAEAVSNAWDAEATLVEITIDRKNESMIIKDNGIGMNDNDFTNKFLRIGYSRREDASNCSKRKILGRKGIGKLALLSVSEKITIYSKKREYGQIGGYIENTELDFKIKEDQRYELGSIHEEKFTHEEHGTIIEFEKIKPSINDPEIIKTYLAILFNFSFSSGNEKFIIEVNENTISRDNLQQLNETTEFLWTYNLETSITKKLLKPFKSLKKNKEGKQAESHIKGYVASVEKPRDLKIHGTGGEFKAGLHLFVNGRLRQENIFNDISSQRVVESYLYGEIHVDNFDEGKDIFTSNREGILKDDKRYQSFLEELKKIQSEILADWDEWRSSKHKKTIEEVIPEFSNLRLEKQKAIHTFLKYKEDDGLKQKFKENFLKTVIPKPSSKKILISHSSENQKEAEFIYKIFKYCGFSADEILYTNSATDVKARLPTGVNIFDYIREFFIQDWIKKPYIFFILSKEFESSWFACLEAGATWVINSDHSIAVLEHYKPKDPLNSKKQLYMELNSKKIDTLNFFQIFEKICHHFNKDIEQDSFEKKLKELYEEYKRNIP